MLLYTEARPKSDRLRKTHSKIGDIGSNPRKGVADSIMASSMELSTEEKRIQEELTYIIYLTERVRTTVDESESFKADCQEVGKLVDRLLQMLRNLARIAGSSQSLYERPIRRVISEVYRSIERALTLVRKCKRRSVLRRVVTIVTAADFRKLLNLLDASVGDMKWLLSIFDTENGGASGGIVLSLPPIASTDPILSWVWSCIAAIHMGQLSDRIEAATELASLAEDNDRNKKIIVEEGGIPPLLKLLKETSSWEAQIAAATALYNIANDQERVRVIVSELGIPIIVNVLADSLMKVQIQVASLVARMAEHDNVAKDDFARENVIGPLVTILSFETFVDDQRTNLGKQSIHSIVQINKEMEKNTLSSSKSSRPYVSLYSEGSSSRSAQNRKERENEKPEVKIKLKICCAQALWMLAKGSVPNSRRITETKGLLCLAKLVEKEQGDLQKHCLMTIMEITAAAEGNADLRRAAFKTNSAAAKAVVDQLLRVIKDSDNSKLQIAAIRSIGSLARTFPARETRVLGPLVDKLSNGNPEVAIEAAFALQKFACPDNFLCKEHSKAIIEFNGVPHLIKLLRVNDRTLYHGLYLLSYLALHAGNSEALEQARVLTTLEGADRMVLVQYPALKDLVFKAVNHLGLYHRGVHS